MNEYITETPADKIRRELQQLLNKHSQERGSNTPDFVLARYIQLCLAAFDEAVNARDLWYGVHRCSGQNNLSVKRRNDHE